MPCRGRLATRPAPPNQLSLAVYAPATAVTSGLIGVVRPSLSRGGCFLMNTGAIPPPNEPRAGSVMTIGTGTKEPDSMMRSLMSNAPSSESRKEGLGFDLGGGDGGVDGGGSSAPAAATSKAPPPISAIKRTNGRFRGPRKELIYPAAPPVHHSTLVLLAPGIADRNGM